MLMESFRSNRFWIIFILFYFAIPFRDLNYFFSYFSCFAAASCRYKLEILGLSGSQDRCENKVNDNITGSTVTDAIKIF